MGFTHAKASSLALSLAGVLAVSVATATPAFSKGGVIPVAPFHACPAVGAAPSCAILLVVEDDGTITIYHDDTVGPYDGSDDTLVGVTNYSGKPVTSITVKGAGSGLANFDGDGLCTVVSCAWNAPTGYEGPNTSFVTIPGDLDDVQIDFPDTLADQTSTYFSLEGVLTSAALTARPGTLTANFVAMGDSFSAGEGNSPYLADSDTSTDQCHRSPIAYAPMLSQLHWTHPDPPQFVACSGAVTDDLVHANWEGNGATDENGTFIPEAPQLDALTSDTKLVTLTMGGNDIGFQDVLAGCLVNPFQTSAPGCQKKWTKTVARRIQALRGVGTVYLGSGSDKHVIHPYSNIIELIRAKAPHAKILIAGYPVLFDPSRIHINCTVGSAGHFQVKILKSDATWMKTQVIAVNSAIKAAVAAETSAGDPDVHYVDAATAFQGHALCDTQPWVYPLYIKTTNPADAWVGSFHPTKLGQNAYEAQFAKALG